MYYVFCVWKIFLVLIGDWYICCCVYVFVKELNYYLYDNLKIILFILNIEDKNVIIL